MEAAAHDVEVQVAEGLRVEDDVLQLVARAVRTALEAEAAPPCEVSLYLTDDAEIRELNAQYRGKDSPTDVLSFPQTDDDAIDALGEGMPRLLGDIVISVERARAQAEEYGHGYDREIAFLAVHGTLHLLGYDHEEEAERREMRQREEAILAALELRRR